MQFNFPYNILLCAHLVNDFKMINYQYVVFQCKFVGKMTKTIRLPNEGFAVNMFTSGVMTTYTV
jgi:hypothetical protein